MNLEDIRAQLEEELTWRWNEMRFLHNQLAYISKEESQRCYRKSLLVMLYSHFEGFCKEAFSIFVNSINQEKIIRSEASDCILAASLSEVFNALDSSDKKCKIFRKSLPDDTKLHRFSRQVDFVCELNSFWKQHVDISPDSVVDVESNLKPVVLRKILYRLGFPHDAFKAYEGKIDKLLKYRNNIAHGVEKNGLDEMVYKEIEEAIYEVMNELIKMIMQALKDGVYRKHSGSLA